MAFLQINNPDGTSGLKRPFRLSDIQDIWNGIKSLFRALAGQQFRIISGFDLVEGVYTSGTVWYNGELYEYNSATNPITPSTIKVSFGSVAQDDRVWEGGDTLPFSSRFVCGGDGYNGAVSFTNADFVANIEKYKSYLGDKSVTTAKLANRCVTTDKLATQSVTADCLGSDALLRYTGASYSEATDQTISLYDLVTTSSVQQIIIPYTYTGNAIKIETADFSYELPPLIPLRIENQKTGSVAIKIFTSNGQTEAQSVTLSAQKSITLLLVRMNEGSNAFTYVINGVEFDQAQL